MVCGANGGADYLCQTYLQIMIVEYLGLIPRLSGSSVTLKTALHLSGRGL